MIDVAVYDGTVPYGTGTVLVTSGKLIGNVPERTNKQSKKNTRTRAGTVLLLAFLKINSQSRRGLISNSPL